MAGASDGRVIIDTSLNNKGFIRGIRAMTGQTDGLRSAVKRLGTAIGAVFAVKAVVDFGKKAVQIGSDVAEVQNVVDTAFGELTGQAEEFASTAITRFGMSALSAKKTASTYMAMARGMGVANQEAADMAITLAGLSGDVASFFNISQELADVKLKSVFTGETETLKDLGVVMTQDNLKAYALSKGFKKSYEAMSQAEKVALRYQFVLDSLALANGDFARTQDSWANQTRILSMQWQEFMGILGQSIITVLKPVVKWLNAVVSHMIALATLLNNTVTKAFGGQSQQAEQAEATSSAIASSVANQEDLTGAVKDTNKAQQKSLAGFDEINKLAGEAAGSAAGIGGVGVGSIKVPEIMEIPDETETFSKLRADLEAFQDALRRIGEVFRESWELNSSAVLESAKRMLTSIYELLKSIGRAFTEAWTGGSGLNFLNAVYGLLSTIFHIIADIADAWKTAFDNVGQEFFESILFRLTAILELINSIGTAFREAWNDGTGVEICETILRILTDINNIFGTIYKKIQEAWEANGNGVAIWRAILGIVQTILDFIERLTQATLDWASSLNFEPLISAFRRLLEAINPLVEVITDGLAWAYEEILLPLAAWVIEEAAPASVDTLTKALEAVKEILEPVKEGFKSLWEALKPLIEWVKDIAIVVIKGLGDIFKSVADTFREHGPQIQEIISKVAEAVSAMWEKVEPIFNLLKELVGVVFSFWAEHISDRIGAVIDTLDGLITFIDGVFSGDWKQAWDGIKQAFMAPVKLILGWIGDLIGAIKDAAAALGEFFGLSNSASRSGFSSGSARGGGFSTRSGSRMAAAFNPDTYSTYQLPRLARGAVIPPNREFLAVLGDQSAGNNLEAPEGLIRKIVREEAGGGGDYAPLLQAILEAIKAGHIIMVDRRILGQTVTQEQNKMTRQAGRSVLLG